VEKVALFSNPAFGDIKRTRISGSRKASEKTPKEGYSQKSA
jgi:hypothetical protein